MAAAAAVAAAVAGLRRARTRNPTPPTAVPLRRKLHAPLQRLMRSCSFEMSNMRPREFARVSCSHPSNMATAHRRGSAVRCPPGAPAVRVCVRRRSGALGALDWHPHGAQMCWVCARSLRAQTSCISTLPPPLPAGGSDLTQRQGARSQHHVLIECLHRNN